MGELYEKDIKGDLIDVYAYRFNWAKYDIPHGYNIELWDTILKKPQFNKWEKEHGDFVKKGEITFSMLLTNEANQAIIINDLAEKDGYLDMEKNGCDIHLFEGELLYFLFNDKESFNTKFDNSPTIYKDEFTKKTVYQMVSGRWFPLLQYYFRINR